MYGIINISNTEIQIKNKPLHTKGPPESPEQASFSESAGSPAQITFDKLFVNLLQYFLVDVNTSAYNSLSGIGPF